MPCPKKSLHLAPVWNSFHTFSQDENWGLFSFEWFFLRQCKNPNYWAGLDWVLNHQYSALVFTHTVVVWFVTFAWFFRDFGAPAWLPKEPVGVGHPLQGQCDVCCHQTWVRGTQQMVPNLLRRWWHLGCCGWNFWVQLTSLAGWGERRAGLLLWGSLQLEEKETPVAVRWKLVLNILWD